MYKGPIELPIILQLKCIALIDIGSVINIFPITLFLRVAEVNSRLLDNQLMFHDLLDLERLCSIILNYDIKEDIKEGIEELKKNLNLFIIASSTPTMPCGMWTKV